jgi:Transposase.
MVHEVTEEVGISKTTCLEILTENFGMHCVAAKFVLRLKIRNKIMLMSVKSLLNVQMLRTAFFKNIVTGEETRDYSCDVETKAQSSQWVSETSPNPEKAQQVWCNVKVMLCFFGCEGVIHYEFLPCGQMVNKEYYLEVMRRLREAVRRIRPDLWGRKKWWFQRDNILVQSPF